MDQNIKDCFKKSLDETAIPRALYKKYSVKKGLRNEDGTGVLVGLTNISDVVGYKKVDGEKVDDYGTLYYRGINVKDIIENGKGRRFLYEEVCFLILFGYLPNREELAHFKKMISDHYTLPERYLELNILGYPEKNLMNKLQREVLMLYSYDDDPDNVGVLETLYKGIDLIAKIPVIVSYTYQSKVHHFDKGSMVIHHQNYDYSIAEQILYLLRRDGTFSNKEAEVLNLAVKKQMELVINEIGIQASELRIRQIVQDILDGDFNDHTGLIYGIGHAVYTLSDPRSEILAKQCEELSYEKFRHDEYEFYRKFSAIAIEEIYKRKGIHVCTNVDFYSGLVYDMLGIPEDLYTLLFVIGRTVGWVAHNIESKLYSGRIVRPATKFVGELKEYKNIEDR